MAGKTRDTHCFCLVVATIAAAIVSVIFDLLRNPASEVLEVPVIMRVAEEARKEIQDALG